MTQAEYTAAEQTAFDKAEKAFDANPCKKTATVLAQARVDLQEKKYEWMRTPEARRESNLKSAAFAQRSGMFATAKYLRNLK